MAKYPPGSTFKLVNGLIGLQEGVITKETAFGCSQGYHFGGVTVGCHGHPSPLAFEASIQHSCNSYYCNTFRKIIDNRKYGNTRKGFEVWRDYVLSFGIGRKLDTDLHTELKGNVPTSEYYDRYFGENRWKSLTIISLAIGQGEMGVTPLQMANLGCIIANRGYYYIPHVVKEIKGQQDIPERFRKKQYTKVDSKYFELTVYGMWQVVEAGTARIARIDSIPICGKTGTAQNPHGEDHSIFLAFAPMDKPKIAIAVYIENGGFGATWAAPIASLMIEKYITGKITRPDLEKYVIDGDLIP
jgi:penicillin-binding protein 2